MGNARFKLFQMFHIRMVATQHFWKISIFLCPVWVCLHIKFDPSGVWAALISHIFFYCVFCSCMWLAEHAFSVFLVLTVFLLPIPRGVGGGNILCILLHTVYWEDLFDQDMECLLFHSPVGIGQRKVRNKKVILNKEIQNRKEEDEKTQI